MPESCWKLEKLDFVNLLCAAGVHVETSGVKARRYKIEGKQRKRRDLSKFVRHVNNSHKKMECLKLKGSKCCLNQFYFSDRTGHEKSKWNMDDNIKLQKINFFMAQTLYLIGVFLTFQWKQCKNWYLKCDKSNRCMNEHS